MAKPGIKSIHSDDLPSHIEFTAVCISGNCVLSSTSCCFPRQAGQVHRTVFIIFLKVHIDLQLFQNKRFSACFLKRLDLKKRERERMQNVTGDRETNNWYTL